MRDQLSNRPFSTWLTYSPIFIFLFFPSSDLDFLAKIFVKQEIKLVWPYICKMNSANKELIDKEL